VDSYTLFLSLFVSTLGLAYCVYGRKAQEYGFLFAGAIMMVYGYLLTSFWLALAIGIALIVAPFLIR